MARSLLAKTVSFRSEQASRGGKKGRISSKPLQDEVSIYSQQLRRYGYVFV
jgi:hypothetical protein